MVLRKYQLELSNPMQYQKLQSEIASGHIRHCYLFYGEEKYLIEKTVAGLTDKILGTEKNNFNYQIFYGSETSSTAIKQAAMTVPFLSRKKLLLIKETEKIPDAQNLIKLIEKPPGHCYLIFLAENADFRRKFYAAFRKVETDVKFWRLFESKIPGWIRRRVGEAGFKISSDAVDSLIGLCGNDLMALDNELGKTFLYVEEKKTIDREDVEKVGGGGAVHTVFELTHSIGCGSVDQAIGIVDKLLLAGEHPLKIMALIVRQFRIIWQSKQMLSQGDSPEMIGRKLGVGKMSLKNFLAQTRRFNNHFLKRNFEILLDYDVLFKSSKVPHRLLMELLILDLCCHKYG